jgi:hypothetical protein
MNLLAWLIGLSSTFLILSQAVAFHRATVCRQKIWGKSFESLSRSFLKDSEKNETRFLPSCQARVKREEGVVTWRKDLEFSFHKFEMDIKGKL